MNPGSAVPEDVALLRAVARRDEQAFAQLYDRYSGVVFGLLKRMVPSPTEAETVLLQAFWEVWNRAGDYHPELGSPSCWIIGIAHRHAIAQLRTAARHLQKIDAARQATTGEDFLPPALPGASTTIQAALRNLPLEERRALALAFFDGLTHAEIGRATGVPEATAKAQVHSGLMKLKAPSTPSTLSNS